jgi:N-acetylglucosamine kinase-like BadF-type ATPase
MSYLCVDGGQTKTTVSLLDEEGRTMESWVEGPLTTPSKPGAADNLRAVVRSACEELGRRLERTAAAPPEAACLSLTGYHEGDEFVPPLVREEVRKVVPALERIHVIPDYVGNWAAATAGEPAVMVLSGGAVAYGRNASGASARAGGWGHLLGDEGSGYWIGLEAIKTVFRARDGMVRKTGLEDKLLERFEVAHARELLNKVYSGVISEPEIAGLVPLVDSLAWQRDETSMRIMERAAAHLLELVVVILEKLGELPVYLSGGVWNASTMDEQFRRLLVEAGLDVEVSRGKGEPWEGIFMIAKGKILEQDTTP